LKPNGSTSPTVQPARALTAEHSLLTVVEVAELLKVPVSWVYERTRKRGIERIPGFRLGKYWRFHETDVLAWIERQRVGGRADA
jgi:excisionase family DNA binding protein